MANPFEIIAQRLLDLGVFGFLLPWIITAAIFWGLLKRSELFSNMINAVLSIAVSFFIWGYLITAYATDIAAPLSAFVMQGFIVILVFVFGMVASSMFYPKFSEMLLETLKSKSVVWMFIGIFIILFFTSGLYTLMFTGPFPTGIQGDVLAMVIILVALIIGVFILVSFQKSQKKE